MGMSSYPEEWKDTRIRNNNILPSRKTTRRELKHGIPITDENDNRLGESTQAAQQAISQVVVSRILMASPGMGRSTPDPRPLDHLFT